MDFSILISIGALLVAIIADRRSAKVSKRQDGIDLAREKVDIATALHGQDATLSSLMARMNAPIPIYDSLPKSFRNQFSPTMAALRSHKEKIGKLLRDIEIWLNEIENVSPESTSMEDIYRLKAEVNGRSAHVRELRTAINEIVDNFQSEMSEVAENLKTL